jgi:hypothetical protein
MQPTTKFEDLSKVIKEDYGHEMMPDVVRDQSGQATEYPPQASNVKDIFNKNNRTDVAPENIPYPLNEFDDVVANAFVSLQNLEELLKHANTNTVIKDKSPIDKISKEIIGLKGKLVDISKKVSKIK